jgi:hypothetical protein
VIGWTELLYCRANFFEAIVGIHEASRNRPCSRLCLGEDAKCGRGEHH